MQRGRFLLAGALVAALLTTAGCAAGTSGNDAGSDGGSATGGTLTVAAAQGIPQLNPAIRTFAWEEVLFPLLWNGLTKTDESGAVVGDLAEKWEASDDQKTWTFTLRDGVTFSDGTPFTAETAKAALDYYVDPDTATQEKNKISMISDVTATDDTTLTVTLSEPVATFPAALVWVKMIDASKVDSIDKEPIGTGPYTVSKFTPDDSVTLVPNEKYFGDKPALDQITIVKAAESTAAVTGLRSGDIDVLWSVPQVMWLSWRPVATW
jgi:peptide/nickel transport system substrate-binding protein